LRSEWDIEVITDLPPSGKPKTLYPDHSPSDELYLWIHHLLDIQGQLVPSRYRLATDWQAFLSLCALRDPPDDGLLKFADYGEIRPETLNRPDEVAGRAPAMLAPPVEQWPNPYSWANAYRDFFERVLREIGERHLKPRGLDIHEMFRDVLQNTNLQEELREQLGQLPRYDVIVVDEHTSDDAVRTALKLITATQERRPSRGRRPRDRLTAVSCAVLYDRHDWSVEQLREHHGWTDQANWLDPNSVEEYIKDGRSILATQE
jgi:hypothetical protein